MLYINLGVLVPILGLKYYVLPNLSMSLYYSLFLPPERMYDLIVVDKTALDALCFIQV